MPYTMIDSAGMLQDKTRVVSPGGKTTQDETPVGDD